MSVCVYMSVSLYVCCVRNVHANGLQDGTAGPRTEDAGGEMCELQNLCLFYMALLQTRPMISRRMQVAKTHRMPFLYRLFSAKEP